MSSERAQCQPAPARDAPARAAPARATLTALSCLFVFASTLTAPAKDDAPAIADVFAETTTTLKVMPDTPGKEVSWSYTNHTDAPLAIERIDISCGCLSALTKPADDTAADALATGETGAIRATFTPGPYRGLIRKSLHVRFVGHDQPVELVAEATIPNVVELTARDLTWHEDDTASQTLDLTAGTKTDVRITQIDGVLPDHYQIEQATHTAGRHYRLTITPTAEAPRGISTLKIHTDSPDPRDQILAVFLHRKPKPTR